jgi:hypothetical protein
MPKSIIKASIKVRKTARKEK